MSATIIVYGPNGAEKHTRANARDLVNGAGYSWQPNIKSNPAHVAPFAQFVAPAGPAPSQKVLDSVGSTSASGATGAAAAAAAAQAAQAQQFQEALAQQAAAAAATPVPTEVVDFSKPPVVDASDLDDDADAADAEVVEEDVVTEAEVVEDAPAEEAPAAAPTLTEVPRGRGGRRKA